MLRRGGSCETSLASDTVAELADETIPTSRFCTSSGVGGEEDNTGEVKVELEHGGNKCETKQSNVFVTVVRSLLDI